MLCGSSYDNNPKIENSAAYFLVLLHIMIKENTNFAPFTLEVMGPKGQRKWFSYQKAILYLLLISPIKHPISPVSLNAHLHTQRSWNMRGEWDSHFVLCPAGNWAPLQTHRLSELAGLLFCFIPSSYTQEKPEFQQDLFYDVFLDLWASVGTHLSLRCLRTLYTHKLPHQRDRGQLLPKLFKSKNPTQVLAQSTQMSKEWVCEWMNMTFLKYCFRLH